MIFLPVAERELRVRARQTGTFRTRVGAALAASLIIGFFLVSHLWQLSPAAMGEGMFWFLSGLAFVWCLLEGPRNTADALSEEKREGTLGLLFLTDLKGYDVVLGKLLATSLNSIYGVLAVVPPLSIPLLLGGVTPGEFWRMVLLLLVTLIFSLSAGMLISANSRNERRAWIGAMTLIGFLAIIPPLFRWAPLPSTMLLGALSPTVGFYSLGGCSVCTDPAAVLVRCAGSTRAELGILRRGVPRPSPFLAGQARATGKSGDQVSPHRAPPSGAAAADDSQPCGVDAQARAACRMVRVGCGRVLCRAGDGHRHRVAQD
jgi:hypothetical protein